MYLMYSKGRAKYNLGFSAQQVAKLATIYPARGPKTGSWFLKLHPVHPHLTVSTDKSNVGSWREDEVRDRKRQTY